MKRFGVDDKPFLAVVDIPEGDPQELTTVTDQAMNSWYGEAYNLLKNNGITPTATTDADLNQVTRAVLSAISAGQYFTCSGSENNKTLLHIREANYHFKKQPTNNNGFEIEFVNNLTNTGAVVISILDPASTSIAFTNTPLVTLAGKPLSFGMIMAGTVVRARYDSSINSFRILTSTEAPDSLREDLANNADPLKGISLVGGGLRVVNNIAELRGLPKTGCSRALVVGYYTPNDGGGGIYNLDLTDKTSADDLGSIIVANDGARWKLLFLGAPLSLKQFGAKASLNVQFDVTANFNAWIQALLKNDIEGYIPKGVYYVTPPITIDLVDYSLPTPRTSSLRISGSASDSTQIAVLAGAVGDTEPGIKIITTRVVGGFKEVPTSVLENFSVYGSDGRRTTLQLGSRDLSDMLYNFRVSDVSVASSSSSTASTKAALEINNVRTTTFTNLRTHIGRTNTAPVLKGVSTWIRNATNCAFIGCEFSYGDDSLVLGDKTVSDAKVTGNIFLSTSITSGNTGIRTIAPTGGQQVNQNTFIGGLVSAAKVCYDFEEGYSNILDNVAREVAPGGVVYKGFKGLYLKGNDDALVQAPPLTNRVWVQNIYARKMAVYIWGTFIQGVFIKLARNGYEYQVGAGGDYSQSIHVLLDPEDSIQVQWSGGTRDWNWVEAR